MEATSIVRYKTDPWNDECIVISAGKKGAIKYSRNEHKAKFEIPEGEIPLMLTVRIPPTAPNAGVVFFDFGDIGSGGEFNQDMESMLEPQVEVHDENTGNTRPITTRFVPGKPTKLQVNNLSQSSVNSITFTW